jgi:DDE domain
MGDILIARSSFCVRWCLRYKISLRDLVEMMAERGCHSRTPRRKSLWDTTILRWVQRYTPEFVKRWNRFSTPTGRSWRVDETYLKIRGKWVYLYRAVDRAGQTVDFMVWCQTRRGSSKSIFQEGQQAPGPLKVDSTTTPCISSRQGNGVVKISGRSLVSCLQYQHPIVVDHRDHGVI